MGVGDEPRNMHFSNMHRIAIISLLSSSSMVAKAFVVAPSSPAATAFSRASSLSSAFKPGSEDRYSERRWALRSALSSSSGEVEEEAAFSANAREPRLCGHHYVQLAVRLLFGDGRTIDAQQGQHSSISITRPRRLHQTVTMKAHSSKHEPPSLPPSSAENASLQGGEARDEKDRRKRSKEKLNSSPRKHGSADSKHALSSSKDTSAAESNNVVSAGGLTIPIPIQIPTFTDGWNVFGGSGNSTAAAAAAAATATATAAAEAAAHATNVTITELHETKAS